MIRLLSAGVISQFVVAAVALIRTPIIISSIGPAEFGSYVALIGAWAVLAAVGEGYRANLRQNGVNRVVGFQNLTINYLKSSWISVVAVVPAIIILSVAGINRAGGVDWGLFIVVVLLGLSYPIFSGAVGNIEAQGKFTWFHVSTICGQILSLIVIIFLAHVGNVYLFAIVTLLPAFVPGFVAVWKMRNLVRMSPGELEGNSKFNRYYSLVIVFETIAYSLDSAILLAMIGPVAAAEFAITQRLMVFFSIIPIILSPLIAFKASQDNTIKWLKNVQKNQTIFALLISIFLLTFSGFIFQFLTHGLLEFSIWLVAIGCLNGVIGSFASTAIQSVSAPDLMKARFFGAVLLAVISTVTTFLLLPLAGPSSAFFGTMLGTVSYWLVAKKIRSK